MIKRVNKKGQQEGIGLGTLLVLIVGVVALVIIIVGVTAGFNQVFGIFGLLPDDLTKMATTCKSYSETEALRISYCQFNEGRIEGKKGWYNCEYVYGVIGKTIPEGPDFTNIGCVAGSETTQCENLKATEGTSYKDKVIVNGQTCASLGVLAD